MHLPAGKGSRWHYSVAYDFFIDTNYAIPGIDWSGVVLADTLSDSVTLTVASDTVLSPAVGTAVEWKFSQNLDSLGFPYDRLWLKGSGRVTDGDTVAWYIQPTAKKPAFYFVAPLEDGQEWLCTDCIDYWWVYYQRSWVEYVPELDTPARRFSHVYAFTHTFECGDECGGLITLYLVNRVGLVKLNQRFFSGGSAGGNFESQLTWVLEEYELE